MKSTRINTGCFTVLVLLVVSCAPGYYSQQELKKIHKADYYWCEESAEVSLRDGASVIYPLGFTAERDTIRTEGLKIFPVSMDTFRIYTLPAEEIISIRFGKTVEGRIEPKISLSDYTQEMNLAAVLGMLIAIVLIYSSSI